MLKSNLSSVCIALCFTFFSYSATAQLATKEATPSVTAAKNKATSEQSYIFFNDNKLAEASKLYADDYKSHNAKAIKGPE